MTIFEKRKSDRKSIIVYPSIRMLFLIIPGVIVILFLAVFLFTQPAFISYFSLTDKGPIGDAINGITGPIIALISAGLLFYSFQAQIEANKRQLEANKALKSQWEFDTYYRLYGEVEKAYNESLEMTVTSRGVDGNTSEQYRGSRYIRFLTEEIIRYFTHDEDDEFNQFLMGHMDTIEFIIEDLIVLINYVRDSDVNQKHFFLHRINRFYNTRLEGPLGELYKALTNNPNTQKSHSLYEELIRVIVSIRQNELRNNILDLK